MEQQPQSGDLKSALSNCVAMLRSLIVKMATIVPTGTPQAENWYSILESLQKKLDENRCRMAVVGTVKSGKSTLVNSLLGTDLLKRGAGIVTAMITRIEPGDRAGAVLSFKDWEEVNGELNSALSLFPSPVLLERQEGYDIRQEEDRQLLREALAQADQAQLLHLDMLDKNYILIKSFLEGYAEVQKILDTGSQRLQLNADELAAHQQMVGREAEAVYLKDVRLTLPFPWPAKGLQLGDCQGSDSPIPQHLAQVQNYLIGADLVVYVVSSRIGLRQADYKFLTDLKRMRLWENCVFILNLDLNETGESCRSPEPGGAVAAGIGGVPDRSSAFYVFRPRSPPASAEGAGSDPQPQRSGHAGHLGSGCAADGILTPVKQPGLKNTCRRS